MHPGHTVATDVPFRNTWQQPKALILGTLRETPCLVGLSVPQVRISKVGLKAGGLGRKPQTFPAYLGAFWNRGCASAQPKDFRV